MNRRHALMSAAALLSSPLQLRAQTAATPLRLIVPTPAGGASDAAARLIGQAWTRSGARQVTVENRPGAGGALAARALLDARPDGQTLLWALASMAGIPVLQKSPPFASLAEFAPVGLAGHLVFGLFVPADAAPRSVSDLVAQARARPDALSCAHGTLGEMMAATQFMKASGTRVVLVPYKGGAQLMPDLASGRVQLNFGPLAGALPQIQAGRVRALAVLSDRRSPLLPEVPTLAEAGVAAAGPLPTWQALLAPPQTPAAEAQRLSRELGALLRDAELRAALERLALQPEASTPEALAGTVASATATWRQFVAEHAVAAE
ncbi:MAG: tripartite tricarboxylate transporter substrate binding protein [Rubrivivax sp.]